MTDKSVDWRTLPAGRVLDRVIAERLGWTLIGFDDPFWRHRQRDDAAVGDYWRTSEGARKLPAFSTDANAALTLWGLNSHWSLNPDANDNGVHFEGYYPYADNEYGEMCELADTPALAICRAWLAWMDAKEGKA